MIAAFLVRAIEDPVIREGGLRFRRRVEERIGALLLTAPRRDDAIPTRRSRSTSAIQTAFALMQQHVLIEETQVGGRALSDDELRRELATHVPPLRRHRRRRRAPRAPRADPRRRR